MTTVTQSTYTTGPAQEDGRAYVTESHLLSDGSRIEFEYLADSGIDPSLVMQARAQRVDTELANRAAVFAQAQAGEVGLEQYVFRERFTGAEQEAIDEFNATFESNPALTAAQKRKIRTGLKTLEVSKRVYLTNPKTIAGVQMYEALGLLAPGRAAEILNG